jgi:hypothetical protein
MSKFCLLGTKNKREKFIVMKSDFILQGRKSKSAIKVWMKTYFTQKMKKICWVFWNRIDVTNDFECQSLLLFSLISHKFP